MTIINQPLVGLNIVGAQTVVPNSAQKILLVGQKTTGSAVALEIEENISSSGNPEDALFGADSMISDMIRTIKSVNKVNQIDVLVLEDLLAGTARQLTMTFTGTSTEAGSLNLSVGGKSHTFSLVLAAGATAQDASDSAAALINASMTSPFSASSGVGAILTLTAKNKGTVANDLGVGVSGSVTGIGVSVAETVAGAGDPVLTSILSGVQERYQAVVWPYTSQGSDIKIISDFLDARRNVNNNIVDGVAFVTVLGSEASVLTKVSTLNSDSLVVFADKAVSNPTFVGPAQNEPGYNKSALVAGIRALRLTDGESISAFVTSPAARDQFGGPASASLPYFNTPLARLPLIPQGRGWTDVEIENLFDAGVSVMGVNRTGTTPLLGEVVTTRLTDNAGNPDLSFRFLNAVDTMSQVREFFFNNYKSRYAQSRLTAGALTPERDMANEASIRAFSKDRYEDLAGPDFVLVQEGEEARNFYDQNLSISLDLVNGRANVNMVVPIIVQFRELLGTISLSFGTN